MLDKYPDYRIVCVDKLTYAGNLSTLAPVMDNPNFRFCKIDICDREAIYKLFEEEHNGRVQQSDKRNVVFFQYQLERILKNQQVQDYLYNLYHFSNKKGVPMTFKYLFEYGEKEKLFSKDIYDKESYKDKSNYFHQYINF